jgi:tetratricopeptide (TPR) repeat protein
MRAPHLTRVARMAVPLMLRSLGVAPHTSCLGSGSHAAASAAAGGSHQSDARSAEVAAATGGGSGVDGVDGLAAVAPDGAQADGTQADDITFEELRADQNRSWAAQSVAKGVTHMRAGKNIAAYKHAVELDPKHTDAFVARGALLANLYRYKEALADFEIALELCPEHANAREYRRVIAARCAAAGWPLATCHSPTCRAPHVAAWVHSRVHWC